MSLIIKLIEIIFKTYGNFIYFTNPWKIFIKIHEKLYYQSNYLFNDYNNQKPMVIILNPMAIIIYLAISQKHIKDSNKIILFHHDNYSSHITNI